MNRFNYILFLGFIINIGCTESNQTEDDSFQKTILENDLLEEIDKNSPQELWYVEDVPNKVFDKSKDWNKYKQPSAIDEVVKWEFETQHIDSSIYEIIMTAQLGKTWFLYSQNQPTESVSLPTLFSFEGDNFELIGETKEPKTVTQANNYHDHYFDSDEVVFRQRIRLLNSNTVTMKYEYMAFNLYTCIAPAFKKHEFTFSKTD